MKKRRRGACLGLAILLAMLMTSQAWAEDGYDLWLRYQPITDTEALETYRDAISGVLIESDSPTLDIAREEISRGLNGLLGSNVPMLSGAPEDGALIIGTPQGSEMIAELDLEGFDQINDDGFVIHSTSVRGEPATVIAANTDQGVLYGVYHFLRLIQTQQPIDDLALVQSPRIERRVLNHWDNLDRTVERGYAGFSLWEWHKLPDYLNPRYIDYARANASLGINGTVLTNVNADATVLMPRYLDKVKALADLFRPYGIRVYLTARFSAPMEIGGLETADPLDPDVRAWWQSKVDEIYERIPDFGGFLVKANSEGQPGPGDYDRSHAEGANMLADAVAPHDGIIMWRAFVYSPVADDRHKQAYDEFVPLDGDFHDNVLVQVKNGPIDFQPREPFNPLFGAMPSTSLMMEFQITKEYLGQGTHLAYLAPLFKEALDADTYAQGEGSTVAKVIDGSLSGDTLTAIAGVANTGTDRNWTGSHFNQANWYAYGRLAWNHDLSAEAIADEWVRMTYTNDPDFVEPVKAMMMGSREAVVDYMTPLGLHHLMGESHHYGPAPWIADREREDWTNVYYHRATRDGVGFDRTSEGTNAVGQYAPPVQEMFEDVDRTPEKYLLWFHHVPWDHEVSSGRTLWDELVYRYNRGVEYVRDMRDTWASLEGMIDEQRYRDTEAYLEIQEKEAIWWRDASLSYFQTFSGQEIPEEYELPAHTLEYYQSLKFPFAPGI